jgi:hypothetical protein
MTAHIALEPEQAELFGRLVEAVRSRPRPERDEFVILRTSGPDFVDGNGIRIEVLYSDLMTFANEGLIEITQHHSVGTGFNFYIPPFGFEFYEQLKRQTGTPVEQVETTSLHYLEQAEFQKRHPRSYALWREAADLLWGADSDRELSTIGHKCREAVQAFTTELIEKHGISDAEPDITKTRDRLSAVFTARHPAIGQRHRDLLDNLFAYWVAACDLIQRQEHASQKEGEELRWEDGRRVVFHTAIVMFEIDRTLS